MELKMLSAPEQPRNEVAEECAEIKGRDPWFPFFVDEWRAGTAELTDEQKGIYIDLLVEMWARKGGLPTDIDELAQILRRDRRKVRRVLDELMGLANFGRPSKRLSKPKLKILDGRLVNGRMMETILRHRNRSEKQAQLASRPRKIAEKSQQSRSKVAEKSLRTQIQNVGNSEACASHPDPDPDPEKKDAADAAGVVDLNNLSRQLIDAAGEALANQAAAPGLANLATPSSWIEQGCDLERDILPTLREVAARRRRGKIQSWEYFTRAVAEARARRLTPLPEVDISSVAAAVPMSAQRARNVAALQEMGIA